MNVERSRVYAYFMFVVEAMLRYVTFRLSSRDVSSRIPGLPRFQCVPPSHN